MSIVIVSMAFGTNWSYNFGTGTGNYATPANSSSTTFLPAPSTNGGTARIYLGNGGGAFNLNNQGLTNLGTDTELKITASTSSSLNKFSIYSYTNSKIFVNKFTILLGDVSGGSTLATSGTFYFFQGSGTMYSNDSAFSENSQVFTGIQWTFGTSGAITTKYRNGSSWTALGSTPFSQANVYNVEIYGNNSTPSSTYYRAGNNYSVAANKQDIWVNGTLIGNDLAKAGIAADTNINAFLFYGTGSSSNVANCFLDDITYSNAFPTTPIPTVQASNITFTNITSSTMTINWTNGNGVKRIVKMNSINSFTAPSDGTDPTTDNSWNSSGEQIIYNGSNSNAPVTGLATNTNYYFRVYEYNGSETGTKYITSTATNNPKNQTTAAVAPVTLTQATNIVFILLILILFLVPLELLR